MDREQNKKSGDAGGCLSSHDYFGSVTTVQDAVFFLQQSGQKTCLIV